MKYIYVIISALLLANIAGAKGTNESITSGTPGTGGGGGGKLPPHFGSGAPASGNKGEFRLVAKTALSFKSGKFIPVDSMTYSFSNGRNGYTKKDDWNNDETVLFDESFTYFFNELKNDYDKKVKRVQTYNEDNYITSITYTTLKKDETWKDSIRFLYDYANGKMIYSDCQIWQGAWMGSQYSEIKYVGSVIEEMSTPTNKLEFVYSDNKLVSSIESSKTTSGTGDWIPGVKTNYTYNGNSITASVEQTWNISINNWVNTTKKEYAYSGNDLVSAEEFTWDGATWLKARKHTYTYDTKSNELSDVLQNWDNNLKTYINAKQEVSSYNIYNQPLVITTMTWNGSSWASANDDKEFRFYYDFPTSVQDLSVQNNFKTYPVPASDVVNIDINWNIAQKFSVAIVDMQGRVVRQWSENPVTAYKKTLSVADFASGNYFIKVVGEQSELVERLVVTK